MNNEDKKEAQEPEKEMIRERLSALREPLPSYLEDYVGSVAEMCKAGALPVLVHETEGTWLWNLETGEVVLGEEWLETCGPIIDKSEPQSFRWEALIHPEDLQATLNRWQELSEGLKTKIMLQYRIKSSLKEWLGVISWAEIGQKSPEGKILSIAGVHRPVLQSYRPPETINTWEEYVSFLEDRVKYLDRLLPVLVKSMLNLQDDCLVNAYDRNVWKAIAEVGHFKRRSGYDFYYYMKDAQSLQYHYIDPDMAELLGLEIEALSPELNSVLEETLPEEERERIQGAINSGESIFHECTRVVQGTALSFEDFVTPMLCADISTRWLMGLSRLKSPGVQPSEGTTEVNQTIGSKAMRQAEKLALAVADKKTTVLLLGETGAGKNHMARYIHEHSPRKHGPFVIINCAALPDGLVESELFGYEAGAHSRAERRKQGQIEAADGGTLVLDEIGDLPLHLQAKLLTFLDTGSFTKLGDTKPVEPKVRIIATTNKDLEDEVKNGRFRMDLYYRVSKFSIRVPSLRERKEDLPNIAREILLKLTREMELPSFPKLSPTNLRALLSYDWIGNARELENVLERALICATEGKLSIRDALPKDVSAYTELDTARQQWSLSGVFRADESEGSLLEYAERCLIEQALERANGIKKEAARSLGITWPSLKSKLNTLGMKGSK